jgi:hypothetical protein
MVEISVSRGHPLCRVQDLAMWSRLPLRLMVFGRLFGVLGMIFRVKTVGFRIAYPYNG